MSNGRALTRQYKFRGGNTPVVILLLACFLLLLGRAALSHSGVLQGEIDHSRIDPVQAPEESKKASRPSDGYPFAVRPVTSLRLPASEPDKKPVNPPPGRASRTLQQRLELLADRDVIVMIDQSGSMSTKDCPGGLSRWQWCANQTRDFTSSTAGILKQGITVMTFSDDCKVYPYTTFDTIAKIFQSNQPVGGTHIELAIQRAFDHYFRLRSASPDTVKPLAIAVITDGEPSELEQLREEIIQATRRMTKPDEIAISFIKVGKGEEGNAVLSYLDNDLVAIGAKFDIVDVKSFDELQKEGLLVAMTDGIIQLAHPELNSSPPAPHPAQKEQTAEATNQPPKPAPPLKRQTLAHKPPAGFPYRSDPLPVNQYDPTQPLRPANNGSTQNRQWSSAPYSSGGYSPLDELRQSEAEGEAIRQRLLNQ